MSPWFIFLRIPTLTLVFVWEEHSRRDLVVDCLFSCVNNHAPNQQKTTWFIQ